MVPVSLKLRMLFVKNAGFINSQFIAIIFEKCVILLITRKTPLPQIQSKA